MKNLSNEFYLKNGVPGLETSDLAGDDPLDPESGTNSGSSSEEFILKIST